jgi:hypothetical protein
VLLCQITNRVIKLTNNYHGISLLSIKKNSVAFSLQPSSRRWLAKLVPNLRVEGCCVVSTAGPNGRYSHVSRWESIFSFK